MCVCVQRNILKPCEILDNHEPNLQPHKRLLAQFPTPASQEKVGVTGRVVNADGTLFEWGGMGEGGLLFEWRRGVVF